MKHFKTLKFKDKDFNDYDPFAVPFNDWGDIGSASIPNLYSPDIKMQAFKMCFPNVKEKHWQQVELIDITINIKP